jgi:hypothetical protein
MVVIFRPCKTFYTDTQMKLIVYLYIYVKESIWPMMQTKPKQIAPTSSVYNSTFKINLVEKFRKWILHCSNNCFWPSDAKEITEIKLYKINHINSINQCHPIWFVQLKSFIAWEAVTADNQYPKNNYAAKSIELQYNMIYNIHLNNHSSTCPETTLILKHILWS